MHLISVLWLAFNLVVVNRLLPRDGSCMSFCVAHNWLVDKCFVLALHANYNTCVSAGTGAEGSQTGRTSNWPQEGDGNEEGTRQEDLCWGVDPRGNRGHHQGIFWCFWRGQFYEMEPWKTQQTSTFPRVALNAQLCVVKCFKRATCKDGVC